MTACVLNEYIINIQYIQMISFTAIGLMLSASVRPAYTMIIFRDVSGVVTGCPYGVCHAIALEAMK